MAGRCATDILAILASHRSIDKQAAAQLLYFVIDEAHALVDPRNKKAPHQLTATGPLGQHTRLVRVRIRAHPHKRVIFHHPLPYGVPPQGRHAPRLHKILHPRKKGSRSTLAQLPITHPPCWPR